ncbi:hypothetical protein [uncultured Chryseobacterium sp.]|uniref:hypothetical protein n=1 Tax=uncultured Chryseobacterium sp. TaxID=259322 RepID=UPI0025FBE316|nr:hypothetical protein [uncultured Chryseobacterium sp.]
MRFSEALKQKRNILRNTSEYTKTLYDYIIIPALENEGRKYMEDFKKSPALFTDESCKKYSSSARFKIFLLPKNQI